MKKRVIALILSTLMVIMFTACGSAPAVSSSAPAVAGNSAAPAAGEPAPAKLKFPETNIKVIVPYDPGGGVDVTCRIITSNIDTAKINNKSFVIENMAGGGGAIGQAAGAQAKPDGYTMVAFTGGTITNTIFTKAPFTIDSFTPIAMYNLESEIIIVPPDSPFKTLEDFIAYAKTTPVTISTPGHSTIHHIASAKLEKDLGLQIKYIHNDGAPMQLQQVMGHHTDAAMMSAGEVVGQVADGSVRALGVMSEARVKNLPNVPTFKESGYDYVMGGCRGLAVPKDTPKEVVAYLDNLFNEALNSEKMIKAMEEAGYYVVYKNSADFNKFIHDTAETTKTMADLLSDGGK